MEELRREKRALDREVAACLKPMLGIEHIGWLRERIADNDVFLIVALRVFAPRVIMGRRMVNMREILSTYMGVSKWCVSQKIGFVLNQYKFVKRFREEVDKTFKQICSEISTCGIGRVENSCEKSGKNVGKYR